MKKIIIINALFIIVLLSNKILLFAKESKKTIFLNKECKALNTAYPFAIKSCDNKVLVLNNGVTIPFDDGKKIALNTEEAIDKVNIAPAVNYLFNPSYSYANETHISDGGRIRLYPLITYIYGSTEAEVKKNLVGVNFLGYKVFFNKQNGASKSLQAVAKELQVLVNTKQIKISYIKHPESFSYRHIANNPNLSPHSYGIAVDLNPDFNNYYWSWQKVRKTKNYHFPEKVIAIFEKHGFIWGGRWIHYDTMHFEYRPEFLAYRNLLEKSKA